MAHASENYYVPHGSHWPAVGSAGLLFIMAGAAIWLNGAASGKFILLLGVAILVVMLVGWFGDVIRESETGQYNLQVDRSFRMGMAWFIFSEVMFFGVFFGALYYVRQFAIPWLGGGSNNLFTNLLLWEGFEATWPTNGPADVGGPFSPMAAMGLPAINTIILLSSGMTITIAHNALRQGNRRALKTFLALTILLGFLFVGLQAVEYHEAYTDPAMNLKLTTGIYGSTFFMLTGFHGLHVTVGAIMLVVIWARCMKGHFTPQRHFAFEAVAWYWHFVDVVWLLLFVFVYWI